MSNAKELRELALQSAQKDYNSAVEQLTEVAKQGKFSKDFTSLSDGTKQLLMNAGFKVETLRNTANQIYHRVSF